MQNAIRLAPEAFTSTAASAGRRAQPSICIVTQNQSFGGSEVHTIGLMRALIDRGHSIELIANDFDGYDRIVAEAPWAGQVRLIHTHLRGIPYGQRSDRAGWRRVLSDVESRVMILVKGNYNYGQLGFLRECRRAFDRIVFIEHLEPRERPVSFRRWMGVVPGHGLWWHKRRVLSRAGSRYADQIVAVSARVRDRLVEDIGYDSAKVSVIRNGVAWQQFTRDDGRGRAVRHEHGIPSDAFVFGTLGRLSLEKGIDLAVRAFHVIGGGSRLGRRSYLAIAGTGPERDRLASVTDSFGLRDSVKFLGFTADPAAVLSAYDALLFPSRLEGLPLGLLEGMAAGCVPIVTRISGMPEAVHSPALGWVVAPESVDELASAMKQALACDATTWRKMREAVVREVREHFDVSESHRRLVDICRPPSPSL